MKIIYLLDWKFSPSSGVAQKVLDQVLLWRQLGHKVDLIVICPDKNFSGWRSKTNFIFKYSGTIGRYGARSQATKLIKKLNPNVVYLRFGVLTPRQIFELTTLPVVYEVNTELEKEYARRSRLIAAYVHLTSRIAFHKSLAICVVTRAIERQLQGKFGNKCKCFPNAMKIDFDKTYTPNRSKRLVFVGSSNSPWHGLENIEKLAYLLPEYDFFIIGNTGSSALPNLKFLGELYGQELESFIEGSLAGISTLNLNYLSMVEASPLKTRLYLSRGLPVIGAYEDTAIPENSDFYFRLPSSNNDYHDKVIMNLRNFLKKWENSRVKMSDLKSMDLLSMEKERLVFIQDRILTKI